MALAPVDAAQRSGQDVGHDGDSAHGPPEPGERMPLLDVARALALLGVFAVNAGAIAASAEAAGNRPWDGLATAANLFVNAFLLGKSRTLLMVLFGVGAALLWRRAVARGEAPAGNLLRRFLVLFVVFGLPHSAVFFGDILAHYAVVGAMLVPAMPWLLAGRGTRPLVVAALLLPLGGLVRAAIGAPLPFDFGQAPGTFAAFCVGVWLARRPEVACAPSGGAFGQRVAAVGATSWLLWLAAFVAAARPAAPPVGGDAPMAPAPAPTPIDLALVVASEWMLLGGALCYLGLAWWILGRGGSAARLLARLAPLGRLTLSAYLSSTLVFLLLLGPLAGRVPAVAQLALAAALFAAWAWAAPRFLGRFRLGPAEWLWRRLASLPRPRPTIP